MIQTEPFDSEPLMLQSLAPLVRYVPMPAPQLHVDAEYALQLQALEIEEGYHHREGCNDHPFAIIESP